MLKDVCGAQNECVAEAFGRALLFEEAAEGPNIFRTVLCEENPEAIGRSNGRLRKREHRLIPKTGDCERLGRIAIVWSADYFVHVEIEAESARIVGARGDRDKQGCVWLLKAGLRQLSVPEIAISQARKAGLAKWACLGRPRGRDFGVVINRCRQERRDDARIVRKRRKRIGLRHVAERRSGEAVCHQSLPHRDYLHRITILTSAVCYRR